MPTKPPLIPADVRPRDRSSGPAYSRTNLHTGYRIVWSSREEGCRSRSPAGLYALTDLDAWRFAQMAARGEAATRVDADNYELRIER